MILIAHLHVRQSLTGPEQLAEAEKLFERDCDVPVTVKDCIAALNSKAKAAKQVEVATPKPVKRRRIGRKMSV